ncbi:MAG TPA: hypothetical protein EYP91_07765 [Gammaproteobacteria bacterium]|nr:hypothetical protein [Gammaproteobacteria bacterium]
MDTKLKHEDLELLAGFVIEDATTGIVEQTESSIKEHIGLLLENTAGTEGGSTEGITKITDDIYRVVLKRKTIQ